MTIMEVNWIDIGALDDIPREGARLVRTPRSCIAVFRAMDDRVFALDDRCPHKGGPLSQGIVHGYAVTCPLHNWVIALDTGHARGADDGAVRTHALRVVDGRILIGVSALLHAPLA